jgi:glutamate-1-semialdehyde aminotransferase
MVCKEKVVKKYSLDYFSTFAGEPLSLIAARETIHILENGEYRKYEEYSNYLFTKLKMLLKGTKIRLEGIPTFFRLKFPSSEYALLFAKKLGEKGILLHPYDDFLISSAHNKDILDDALIGISSTISELEVEG